ncbi:hypothetical protein CBR_g81961 [Chara braunii]|uniref:Pectate lyase n=1 Tax=Chara braunii TaxID=69332 RepID=A0A388JL31_CHABU|nr:hypothetical protein CBR_g81961 [Chara braunii]|eukprot:GBG48249.1 hypothetical protein CBR_g81961 [Chara braunii]
MAASRVAKAGSSSLVAVCIQDGDSREKVRRVMDCRPYSSLLLPKTSRGKGDAIGGASSLGHDHHDGLVRKTHVRAGCALPSRRDPFQRRAPNRLPELAACVVLNDGVGDRLFYGIYAASSATRKRSCSYRANHDKKNGFVDKVQALPENGTEPLEDPAFPEGDTGGVVPEDAAISMVVTGGEGEPAFLKEIVQRSAAAEAGDSEASRAGSGGSIPSTVSFVDSNPYPASLDSSRFAIAGKAQGYGFRATGGRGGKEYKVTNFSASGQQGTLEYALSLSEPLWITFDQAAADRAKKFQDGRPMIDYTSLPISRRLISVRSNKTIDGRGLRLPVVLYGCGLKFLAETQNVIVSNICLDGAFKEGKGGQKDVDNMDGIQIAGDKSGNAPSNVWIDRVTLRNYADGLIDITRGSTNVTVSRCLLTDHDKTMLIGSSDDLGDVDRRIRVTVHHNKFMNCGQRHPRVRFGFVHVYNNSVLRWKTAGVGLGTEAQILLQQNYFLQDSDNTVVELKPKDNGRDSQGIASVGDVYNPKSLDINTDSRFAEVIRNFRGASSDLPRSPNTLTVEKIPSGEALAKKLDGIAGAWSGSRFKF